MRDPIERQDAIDALNRVLADYVPLLSGAVERIPLECAIAIKQLQSALPERLTDDDFETIRIHLNSYKEKLCNQHRWREAEEYQRIIDRFMRFASAQSDHFDGWPVWRDGEDQILSIKEIRNITKLSQAKFSAMYGIPQRTLESWEMGERNPPEYVLRLLQRVVMMDMEGTE